MPVVLNPKELIYIQTFTSSLRYKVFKLTTPKMARPKESSGLVKDDRTGIRHLFFTTTALLKKEFINIPLSQLNAGVWPSATQNHSFKTVRFYNEQTGNFINQVTKSKATQILVGCNRLLFLREVN